MTGELDRLCDLLLDEYESRAQISRERVALWEPLYIFTCVRHCWTKVHTE
jgi:hypothetical protein